MLLLCYNTKMPHSVVLLRSNTLILLILFTSVYPKTLIVMEIANFLFYDFQWDIMLYKKLNACGRYKIFYSNL